jgi:DNA gyrase subunit B
MNIKNTENTENFTDNEERVEVETNIESYTAENIGNLDFPKNIQRRPGMYLGSKGEKGKHHTIEEIIANCIDEFNANPGTNQGYGRVIDFSIKKRQLDGIEYESLFIKDRGRGIPIDMHKSGKPALTYILTTLHAGGKIKENSKSSSYVASGGLNGIGASAVMAVSRLFEVTVARDGRVVRQVFEYGYANGEMRDITPQEIDSTTDKKEFLIVENFDNSKDLTKIQEENPEKFIIERGTTIEYVTWDKVDDEDIDGLFDPFVSWDRKWIKQRLHEHAYLNKTLKINYLSDDEKVVYVEEDGVLQYLKDKTFTEENREKFISEPIAFEGKIDNRVPKYIEEGKEQILNPRYKFLIIDLSIGLGVFNETHKTTKHFVNNLPMVGGGKQDNGMKAGITKVLNEIAEKEQLFKNFENNKFTNEDISDVLNFVCSIKIEDPDFEGQTKNKLSNPEAQTLMREFLSGNKYIDGEFKKWCDENIELARHIIKTIETVRKEKKKVESNYEKLLLERMSADAQIANAAKLSDCRSKDKTLTELFICEGDSAAGPIKNSRNHEFQALLPMKGKVLKAWEKDDLNSLAKNSEIGSIITSLGCGWHNGIDIEKCRYSKIIILSDADDDGYHISTLLETLFYKYFRPLVEDGRIYIALSPLFELVKDKKKIFIYNKEELETFAFSEAKKLYSDKTDKELDKLVLDEIKSNKSSLFSWNMKRNKGLGEMEAEDMWDSTLNPTTRRMIKLHCNNNEEEVELINVYMSGEKEYIAKRKEILSNIKIEDF